jgi:hypothetical protein
VEARPRPLGAGASASFRMSRISPSIIDSSWSCAGCWTVRRPSVLPCLDIAAARPPAQVPPGLAVGAHGGSSTCATAVGERGQVVWAGAGQGQRPAPGLAVSGVTAAPSAGAGAR